jgi:hypothetical protein
MVKKLKINTIIIVGLIFLLCISLFTLFYRNRLFEGIDNDNEDNFAVALNVKLHGKNGRIVPYPNGSFNITTNSGNTNKSLDFDMNEVANIKTTYNKNKDGNILNRIVTIKAVPTSKSNNINVGDVIPNVFSLDISFNQVKYKLKTISDLKATNELAINTSQIESTDNLNILDNDSNLIITGIDNVYDKNAKKIGTVSADINNEKAFNIKIDIPIDPKDVLKAYIKTINVTFIYPLPLSSKTNMPIPPPPLPQSVVDSIPPPLSSYGQNKS